MHRNMHVEKKMLETTGIYVFYLIIPALNQISTSKIPLWSHLTPSRRYVHAELKNKSPIEGPRGPLLHRAGWMVPLPPPLTVSTASKAAAAPHTLYQE